MSVRAWIARAFAPKPPAQIALDIPVIAVGSLRRGGTGKTPMVIAVAQRLIAKNHAVHIVTQADSASRLIDARNDLASEVGAQPLLMAAFAPTWISRDLAAGALAAQEAGAQVIVIEGGLPDGAVKADFALLVEDAVHGFGNGFARPFGPLKRDMLSGQAQADVLVTIGSLPAQKRFLSRWTPRIPHATGTLVPLETGMDWEGLDVLAFTSIGVPERFFATLHALKANLIRSQGLASHQELTDAMLVRLEHEARLRGAQLVTTEKDAVRLPRAFLRHVLTVPVRLELQDWHMVDDRLEALFSA
ncbi:MAG: tetraacyldisaccharide 4'-kinase [Maritimibacter sp.]